MLLQQKKASHNAYTTLRLGNKQFLLWISISRRFWSLYHDSFLLHVLVAPFWVWFVFSINGLCYFFFSSSSKSAAPAKLYPPSFVSLRSFSFTNIFSLLFSVSVHLFLLGRSSYLFSAFFSSTSSWKIHWQLRFRMGVELKVIFSPKHFHHPTCHPSSYSSA